jgi:hypothetical protein
VLVFVGFCRALLFFGERTWVGAVFWRDAARVVLAVAGLVAGAAGFCAGARTRFLETSRAAFSLSSLDNSSLLRFLPRVKVVGLAAGLEATGLAAVDLLGAVLARAVRVLAVAVVVVEIVAEAGAFFVGAAFVDATDLVGAGFGARIAGVSSSTSGIWRLVVGMRLTRRSRRDRRLAHCASHCARNFSWRVLTAQAR